MINSATLAKFPLFKDVSTELLEKIAAISTEVNLKEGQTVFREGEKANQLHFLVKGSIALRVNLMTRPDSATVSIVAQPYDCFGWSGVVPPHYYTSTAYCEEETSVLAIAGEKFVSTITAYPADGFKIMLRIAELISDRLRNSRHALLKTL